MGRFLNPKALPAGSEGKARSACVPAKLPRGPREGADALAESEYSTISAEKLVGAKIRNYPKNVRPRDTQPASGSVTQEAPWRPSPVQSYGLSANAAMSAAAPRPVMVTVGNIALFLYLISGELNDLSHHFFGVNVYISW